MSDKNKPNNDYIDTESSSEQDNKPFVLVLPSDALPTTLHIIPITERPFLPAQSLPILLSENHWFDTIKAISEQPQHAVGLLYSENLNLKKAGPEDFSSMGTVVRVHNPIKAEGKIQFVAEGVRRFKVVKWLSVKAPFIAQVKYPDDVLGDEKELRAYAMSIMNIIKELAPLNPLYGEELKVFLNRFSPNKPSLLADFAAALTTAPGKDIQEVIETVSVLKRMKKVLELIKRELEIAKIQAQIHQDVEEKMGKQQREFFLKEQLKVIQKELGISKDDRTADLEKFEQRMEKLTIPEQVKKRIDDEMQKLSFLEPHASEYGVTRNYLDWLTQLPWGIFSQDKLELDNARTILDRDHDGLDDVKDRIIEFIAVGKLKGTISGSIILMVGPPGVGKTSIGHSIADALGRKFFRFSLGGMRDEAEIKGHRRTYIGAMPGKFMQAIKETETANPVIMLDEIDKIGASYQGDPASALLEVLDPEQNSEFLDHYLDVRFDLSKVLFICTANQLDTIPPPLLDRMEMIRLSGYIAEEKVQIAKHHLWPKLLDRAGIRKSKLKISDAAIRSVIEGYAREAGVRTLEKRLNQLIRKAAIQFVSDNSPKISIGKKNIETSLGKPVFAKETPIKGIGVVTGLAWTALGGATLNIEATLVHSKNRGFKLTGQLGDVMRESAEIAYSYIATHLKQYKGRQDFFDEAFVHLHVPEGATPKDGPSAGITMATALLSLARKQQIKRHIAMTGELTLTGQVLPIGGVREKLIAARRINIKEIILPEANRNDAEELPEHIIDGLTLHYASQYSQVFKIVF